MAGVAEPPRVFIDADALVAGSASRAGAAHLILQLGELGVIDLVSSAQVRDEVERVLLRKLPSALPAFAAIAGAAVRWLTNPSAKRVASHSGEAHPKDLPILVAALGAACPVLVTFNTRHFKPKRGSIRIETPGDFIQRLRTSLAGLAD